MAAHRERPFQSGGENFAAVSKYVLLRLRMMSAKIRDMVKASERWEVLSRKMTSKQVEVLLRLARCVSPGFMEGCAEPCEKEGTKRSYDVAFFSKKESSNSLGSEMGAAAAEAGHVGQEMGGVVVETAGDFMLAQFAFNFFHNNDSFLDKASKAQTVESSSPTRISNPDKVQVGASANKNEKRREEKENKSEANKIEKEWHELFGKPQKAYLKEKYSRDAGLNLKMDGKNFASRIYHQIRDRKGSKDAAKKGHQAALQCILSLRKN